MQPDTTDVLIVGAGPTGLTLACALAQRGVDVRIIDASPVPPAGSRGKGLQPRSLELFDDLGIVGQVVANGVLGLAIRSYDEVGNARLESLHREQPSRPDAPYLASLVTPQWRVEEALRDKLAALGRRVRFGDALTGFAQDERGVSADLAGPDGPAAIRARWLVGCDGGRSAVRHVAGIDFLGETLETHRMLVGDVRVADLDRDHWHIWRSSEGFLALCPLPSTDQFQFQASIAPGQDAEVSLDNFRRLAARRSGRTDIRLSDAGWMSLWRANIRMVERYRAGRVFLAGDAAHVHSPAGGQGMNTGIQDAYNLAWKLAAVLGGVDAALLDSYQEERLPTAAGVLGLSTELMATAVRTGTIVFRRDEKTMQLGLGYRGSSLARDERPDGVGLRAGDRAPDATGLVGPEGRCRLFDLLRGPHVTLLGFGLRWRKLIDACLARFGDGVKGHVLAAGDGSRHHVDAEGHARAAYADETLFVVRLDNYVGLATERTEEEAVMAYLAKIVPSGGGQRPTAG